MEKFKSLFSFNGRARRSTYWTVSFGALIVFLIADWLISVAFFGNSEPAASTAPDPRVLVGFALTIAALVMLYWVSLATSVRRCHDRNKSGWFVLIGLIPLIGGFWILLELGVKDGSPERNRYGLSPKFPENAANAFA